MIIGHSLQINYLKKILQNASPAHAYLFHGEEHIGKTTVAEWFARGLMCESVASQKPCDTCKKCVMFQKGIYPDVYRVQLNPDLRDISINQVRALQDKVSMTPFYNSYKIAIIKDAEKINEAGFNCFLKILEEPPLKTIFILIAHTLKPIPSTILSRAEMIHFTLLKEAEIAKALDGTFTIEQKRFIARMFYGKVGFALSQTPETVKAAIEQEKILIAILKAPAHKKILMLEPLIKEQGTTIQNRLASLLRDILLCKIGCGVKITHRYFLKEFHILAERYSYTSLACALSDLARMSEERTLNLNQQLVWNNLFLKLRS
jgi:DNA polymerase-3 subunit delta'